MKLRILTALSIVAIMRATVALATWPAGGVPVGYGPGDQFSKAVTSDGAGGIIVAWESDNPDPYYEGDIYAQRISASGVPLWTPGGVPICTITAMQNLPAIASDGYGGAYIAWLDARAAPWLGVYVQRVDSTGAVVFPNYGFALCEEDGGPPVMTAINNHRAIITWTGPSSLPAGGGQDIYVNFIDHSGNHLIYSPDPTGLDITEIAGDQMDPAIAAGGADGAIVTWRDFRNGGNNSDIYAQRVDQSSFPLWIANGIPICTAPDHQADPTITTDDLGGAIIAWQDNRSGTNLDIYAQRVDSQGVLYWQGDGTPMCTAPDDQEAPRIVSDQNGGAFLAWSDLRHGVGNSDIYAMWMDISGDSPGWPANGFPVCTAPGNQADQELAFDNAYGCVITWDDGRNGADTDIYAQRVYFAPTALWTTDGVVVNATPVYNDQWPVVVSDGTVGGAIVTWADYRNGTDWDLFSQHVEGTMGTWGIPAPQLSLVADIPSDQGGKVKLNFLPSDKDQAATRTISEYSIWRSTDALSASQGALMVGNPADVPADFHGKAIWTQHRAAGDYYWEWIGSMPAHGLTGYSFTAETRADSIAGDSADENFFVSAHTDDEYVYYDSNVMSGHSVDNLAPAAPLYLTAQRVGGDVSLKWNRVRVADLKKYSVYRGTSSGVTPISSNFLADNTDTVMVDASAPTSALYYIVTAYDVHQNQSKPSNEASVSGASSAGNLPPVTALMVLQNHPNPFASETELEIGLPADEKVQLDVYDVAGRRVREETVAGVKGWQEIPFSGLNDHGQTLASGVYFYKVSAGGKTITRKMLITR